MIVCSAFMLTRVSGCNCTVIMVFRMHMYTTHVYDYYAITIVHSLHKEV